MKILIADDIPANIKILGELLRDKYEVLVANNGAKAVQIAQEKKPDLILLDIMMPEMDGFTACSHLRAHPETDEIPVIFITAKNEIEDVVRGFELGAVDYLTKPFNPKEVLVRIHTHLELKRVRDELRHTVDSLSNALAQVKLLSGLLPICAYCKKIRDDKGYWQRVESYISRHSEVTFSHGICPECLKTQFPDHHNPQSK